MPRLDGLRVLVVEDDYLIATDLSEVLEGAGAITVGPVGWLDQAMALALDRSVAVDVAVLDVDLHGAPSYPVAEALAARGVGVLFVTGYDANAIDPAYRSHPRLQKPVTEAALLAALGAEAPVRAAAGR